MTSVAIVCLPTKATLEVCVVDATEVLWRESVAKAARATLRLTKDDAKRWADEAGLNVVSLTQLAEDL